MKDLAGREIDFNELAEEQAAMERKIFRDHAPHKGTRASYDEKSEKELVAMGVDFMNSVAREKTGREKN
jgi:hypothetical protein